MEDSLKLQYIYTNWIHTVNNYDNTEEDPSKNGKIEKPVKLEAVRSDGFNFFSTQILSGIFYSV